jgi:CMP-N,N'-diacetyllegionaminic acid synthase
MKILALITARGNSKRIPKKNMKILCGKPLIEWSIEALKDLDNVCDILVSTDNQSIAEISSNAGAMVPWLRPKHLAQDSSSSVDVAIHALNWYQENYSNVDGLLLIQPTSPFRTKKTILKGIQLFQKNTKKSVISFSPAKDHPLWCFELKNGLMKKYINDGEKHMRSQDLPSAYVTNGAFYLITPKNLIKNHSFYKGSIVPLIMNDYKESLDIDTKWDWEIAELLCSNVSN